MGTVNFVEIDLLRGGDKMPMLDPRPKSPYTLLVARKQFAPHCRVWPRTFNGRCPIFPFHSSIPIPTFSFACSRSWSRFMSVSDITRKLTTRVR